MKIYGPTMNSLRNASAFVFAFALLFGAAPALASVCSTSSSDGSIQCAGSNTYCGNTCVSSEPTCSVPKSLSCGSCACACPGGTVDCGATCVATSSLSCAAGQTPDYCAGVCTGNANVVLSPSVAQNGYINITSSGTPANPASGIVSANGLNIDNLDTNSGSVATGSLRFGGLASGEGIYSRRTAGTNQWGLDLVAGSASRLSITNGGNVGIGMPSPNYKLHVGGDMFVGGGAGFGGIPPSSAWGISVGSQGAGGGGIYAQANIAGTVAVQGRANLSTNTAVRGDAVASNSYGVYGNASDAAAYGGYFNNTAGGEALHTVGKSNLNGQVGIGPTGIVFAGELLNVIAAGPTTNTLFTIRDNAAGVQLNMSRNTILQRGSNFVLDTGEGDLDFRTFGATRMYIQRPTAGGNVGIGTTTPTQTLDVNGTTKTTAFLLPTGAGAGKYLQSDASGNGTWQTPPSGFTGGGTANKVTKWTAAAALGDSMIFDNGTGVGVNTVSPAAGAMLDVNGGTIRATKSAFGYVEIDPWVGSNGEAISFWDGSSPVQKANLYFNRSLNTFLVNSVTPATNTVLNLNGGNVGIGTSAPGGKLAVQDGAVLFNGTTGALPATGAGTRFVWYPGKSAIRAGLSSGPNWDDTNIGVSSAAFGADTRADGQYAFAAGNYAVATGIGSAAFGQSSRATGNYAFAAGYSSTASGDDSAAFGYASTASGWLSFATAQGTASGAGSVAMGQYTTATSGYAQAYGSFTQANGYKSVVIGSGFDGVSELINNTGYSIMFGVHSTLPTMTITNPSPGVGSIGNVGIGTAAPAAKLHVSNGSVLFDGATGGTPVSGAGTRLMWVPAKGAFRAGTVSASAWDDAYVGTYSTAVGRDAWARGSSSFAAGDNVVAYGAASTALGGGGTESDGVYSLASGYGAYAGGNYSVAMGRYANTSNDDTVSLGYNAQSLGKGDLTISTCSGVDNNCSGNYNINYGNHSIALGSNMQVGNGNNYNVLIGNNISTSWNSGLSQFVIGSGLSTAWLNNGTQNSLMVGFNSNTPTLTVTGGNGTTGSYGNVGIGDSSPAALLTVGNGDLFQVNSSGVIDCIQGRCPPNSAIRLTPNLHLNAGAGYAVIVNWDNGTTGTSLAFRVGNGAGADVFDVRADGRVGFGTTSPGYKVDVRGGGAYNIDMYVNGRIMSGDGTGGGNGGNGGMWVDSIPQRFMGACDTSQCIGFYNADGWSLRLLNGFGDVYVGSDSFSYFNSLGPAYKPGGGSWAASSDRRVKKDISSFDDGLDVVRKIRPVNFTYNGLDGQPEGMKGIGVIAQEIQHVASYTVSNKRGSEYLQFDPSALMFVNLNAIQDLDKQLNDDKWGGGSGWQICAGDGECSCPEGSYMTKIKDHGAEVYCNKL